MEDNKIIDLYWERNENAIVQTQLKYGRLLSSISRKILKYEEDVEECVNDTYLGAWNAMPPARPAVLPAFLGKITRNLSLKKYRSSTALKRGQGDVPVVYEELEECLSDTKSIDENLMAQELAETINEFLRGLKKETRQIFVCRYWYFDSVSDIAERFGFSESKVKMTLKRTRDELKNVLAKEDIWV